MKRLSLCVCSVILIASCGFDARDKGMPDSCDWTSYRGNNENTGSVHSECSPGNPAYDLKWKFPTGGAIDQSPVSHDGKIYIGSVSKKFHCVDAKDGESVWTHECDDPITTPAVISMGKVVFGTKGLSLHCLDASTGFELWKHYDGSPVSMPVADEKHVYFGNTAKKFSKLDLVTGEEVWSVDIPAGIKACPAMDAQWLTVGCFDGSVVRISKADGKVETVAKSPGAITTAVVVHDEMLYYATYDGKIHCFNTDENKEQWVFDVGIPQESSPTLWKDRLYFGANNGYFYCLSAKHGTRLWIYDTGLMRRIIGCPVATDGKVWFGSEDNYLYCFDAIEGENLWSYKTGDRIWSSTIIASRLVVLGCNDGNLYCFGR